MYAVVQAVFMDQIWPETFLVFARLLMASAEWVQAAVDMTRPTWQTHSPPPAFWSIETLHRCSEHASSGSGPLGWNFTSGLSLLPVLLLQWS
jgi:hypothetical protein